MAKKLGQERKTKKRKVEEVVEEEESVEEAVDVEEAEEIVERDQEVEVESSEAENEDQESGSESESETAQDQVLPGIFTSNAEKNRVRASTGSLSGILYEHAH
jgi:hypothetical protein